MSPGADARAAGLGSGGACLSIAAVPMTSLDDDFALRSAASALARAAGGVLRPLTVVRQDEIVIVRALEARVPPPRSSNRSNGPGANLPGPA